MKNRQDKITLKTIFDHKDKYLRTLNYIEKHLDQPLKIKNLSNIACLSDYHFHRRFTYYVGDTTSGYVKKRRLLKAAKDLTHTNARVTDVALSTGYETVEAFTKVFKSVFGVPPSAFKKYIPAEVKQKPVQPIILKPYLDKNSDQNKGRKAFWEFSKISSQIQLDDVASIWISVFPDFYTPPPMDTSVLPQYITLGDLKYKIVCPGDSIDFHITRSGSYAVLHYDDQTSVYRNAEKIIPFSIHNAPKHLSQLPIFMRSIVCVPDR